MVLTMAEYIEREALVAKFKKMELGEHGLVERLFADGVYAVIEAFPSADVAPVVHARWIHSRYDDCSEQFELVKCSQCNHEAYAMAFYVRGGNYCPNCGAKMDGGADNG